MCVCVCVCVRVCVCVCMCVCVCVCRPRYAASDLDLNCLPEPFVDSSEMGRSSLWGRGWGGVRGEKLFYIFHIDSYSHYNKNAGKQLFISCRGRLAPLFQKSFH